MRLAILAFAAGVCLLQTQAALPAGGALAGLAAAAVALGLPRCRSAAWPARCALLLCCFLLGFVWAGWRAQWRLADRLPPAWEGREVELVGVVAALPQRFERGERFLFDVESALTPDAVVPKRVSLSWYSPTGDGEAGDAGRTQTVRPGERWRFFVRLRQPHGNANPHGFDYEAWLFERGIRATGTIRRAQEARRQEGFVWRPGYVVERLRDALRERYLATLPDAPFAGILTALAIGDQRGIPAAQWRIFNRTGVTHLMSISGLHVTMVAALFAACANFLWRRSSWLLLRLPAQKAALAAGWLAAFIYAALAGFEVPAQRTLYMLGVVALALASGRHFGPGRVLLLALLPVLIVDPWAVLSVGFWLSFGAVAVLLYVSAPGARDAGKKTGGWAILRRWGDAQWAVTVGGLPLLLLFFQQFSLVSPLANAIAIPLVSLLVTPLALLFAVLPLAALLQLAHALLAGLMGVLEWLAAWPVWQQAAPPGWAVALALAGVVWLLLPRGFPARWLGLCLLLPALAVPPPRPPHGEAWVDLLDVGQGLAVAVRTARHALLYDTGPQYSPESSAAQRVVLPFLRGEGVDRLDALVVSHRDKDHAGGLADVFAALPVGRLLSSLPELGGELCQAGQAWEWDGVRFSILHPQRDAYADERKRANGMSCVLRVEAAGRSLLLPADIEAVDEKALLARAAPSLPSDALVVPHHGGGGSSTPGFVAAVGARDALFSVGYRNAFRHPKAEVLARYAAGRIWRSDRDGALGLRLGAAYGVSAWRAERSRYWHAARPAPEFPAGTPGE